MQGIAKHSAASEELKLAVRRFQTGQFDEARAVLLAILGRDSDDTDAAYFLRLIERRCAPPQPPGPTTLIWQVNPAKAWEGDWVRALFSDCAHSEVVDQHRSIMAPRMIVVDNGLVEEKIAYYRQAFDRGCRIVLVHLSDEHYADDTSAYRYCEAVFRNYRSEVQAGQSRVHAFPLGYKSSFARTAGILRPASSRRYLWSFAGDAKKSSRQAMLAAMKMLPRGYVHLTEGFGSADCLSTDVYRTLMEETLLVPCPGGWSNLESFRVYEALEAGCIPIVERRLAYDYFTDLLGAHPLPTVSHWAEVQELFSGQSLETLESLRHSCESWWRALKRRLRSTLAATVKSALI